MTHRTRVGAALAGFRNDPATLHDRLAEFQRELREEVARLDVDVVRARQRGFPELAKSMAHWRVRLNGLRVRLGAIVGKDEGAI